MKNGHRPDTDDRYHTTLVVDLATGEIDHISLPRYGPKVCVGIVLTNCRAQPAETEDDQLDLATCDRVT